MHNRQNEKVGEEDVNLLIQNTRERSVSETLPSTILKHLLMCLFTWRLIKKASPVYVSTGAAAFSNILSLTVASNRHLGKQGKQVWVIAFGHAIQYWLLITVVVTNLPVIRLISFFFYFQKYAVAKYPTTVK